MSEGITLDGERRLFDTIHSAYYHTDNDFITNELIIEFDDSGVSIEAVGPSQVSMKSIEFEDTAFESAELPNDPIEIGVDLSTLKDALGAFDPGDIVTFTVDTETRRLHLTSGPDHLRLSTIDPSAMRNRPDIPSGLDLPAQASVPLSMLAGAIDTASIMGSTVSIEADGDGVTLSSEGDMDSFERHIDADDCLSYTAPDGPVASTFGLDHLSRAVWGMDGQITFHIGDSMPVRVINDPDDRHVLAMTAPRIQS